MATPFATHVDYEERGYANPFATGGILDARLAAASRHVRGRCPDVDGKIDAGDLDPELVTDIVCAMVHRSASQVDLAGVASQQQTAGPFSQSLSFANPHGDLYLTKGERRSLGCGQRAFTVPLGYRDESSSSS